MREFDTGTCAEIFTELILEQGEIVYGLYWDSGSPVAGCDRICNRGMVSF
jgi:hypothetical protein